MKFDELDAKLRVFETSHDLCVMPEIFMVARIDGRNFTRLTKEVHKFEVPFDSQFRDYMVATTQHLMNCGFKVIYGYTQSDEISLLFHRDEDSFNRKIRKFNSILAGEASAKFSLLVGTIATFDCRISQLPNLELVVDYFRWRNEDAHRNALNGHCYWTLRNDGYSVGLATSKLHKLSVSDKNELLYQHGVNFNNFPKWQKRGIGIYWESYEKEALNPISGELVSVTRKRTKVDMDLPMKDDYSKFICDLVLREYPDLAEITF
jgi:tRNA(His) guanylyltransferase